MHRFGRRFHQLLEDVVCFTTLSTIRSAIGRWRHKIRKFTAKIFQNANNRNQSCAKYLV